MHFFQPNMRQRLKSLSYKIMGDPNQIWTNVQKNVRLATCRVWLAWQVLILVWLVLYYYVFYFIRPLATVYNTEFFMAKTWTFDCSWCIFLSTLPDSNQFFFPLLSWCVRNCILHTRRRRTDAKKFSNPSRSSSYTLCNVVFVKSYLTDWG